MGLSGDSSRVAVRPRRSNDGCSSSQADSSAAPFSARHSRVRSSFDRAPEHVEAIFGDSAGELAHGCYTNSRSAAPATSETRRIRA